MSVALSAALLVLAVTPTPVAPGLPTLDQLFPCPIDPEQERFTPPEHWVAVSEEQSGVALSVPPDWTLERQPHRLEIKAPDSSFRVSVRHSTGKGESGLRGARRALEIAELGLPFVNERCAKRVPDRLKNEAPWTSIDFGYYGRPLGERRRRVALYVTVPTGTVAIIVSTRWPRGAVGPDWATVWALLGGVRSGEGPTPLEVATWTSRRLH